MASLVLLVSASAHASFPRAHQGSETALSAPSPAEKRIKAKNAVSAECTYRFALATAGTHKGKVVAIATTCGGTPFVWGWPGQNPIRYRDPTGHMPDENLDPDKPFSFGRPPETGAEKAIAGLTLGLYGGAAVAGLGILGGLIAPTSALGQFFGFGGTAGGGLVLHEVEERGAAWESFLPAAEQRTADAFQRYGGADVCAMAKKADNRQIDAIVRAAGMSRDQRQLFHQAMRDLKGADGMVSFDELEQLAQDIVRDYPNK
jgi:hypothetical protein